MEQIVLDGSLMQQMVLPQESTRLFERSCSHRFFVILISFPAKAAAILRLRCRVIQHQFLQAVFLHRMKEKSQQPEKPDYWRDFWRRRWDSNPRTLADQLISSLFCNCDGGARFGVVSVSPVPAESRLKSGFFARKALRDRLF